MTQYSEAEIEHIRQSNYLLGIAVGWEQATDDMLDIATRAFRAGEDDTASRLREYARKFRETGAVRRAVFEAYKEDYAKDE